MRCPCFSRLSFLGIAPAFVALLLDSGTHQVVASDAEGHRPALLMVTEMSKMSLSASASTGASQQNLQISFGMEKSIWGSHSGNLYFADKHHHTVKVVSHDGVVKVVAGTGKAGFSGDGGPASKAQLSYPGSIWGDASGRIFIMDAGNNKLRYVDQHDVITTLLPLQHRVTGIWGDVSGNLYLATGPECKILRLNIVTKALTNFAGTGACRSTGDGAKAINAGLNLPNGLWGDKDGQIFIAEMGSGIVRKIDHGGVISTVAGSGFSGFSGDGGRAIDAHMSCICDVWGDGLGQLYVADMDNNRIRRVNTDGTIQTFAGNGARGRMGDGGPATSASLYLPKGIWVDRHGEVYISDTLNFRFRRVDRHGIISTFGKSAAASTDALAAKRSQHLLRIAVPDKVTAASRMVAMVADATGHRIDSLSQGPQSQGLVAHSLVGGSGRGYAGDGSSALAAKLNYPQGMCLAPDGSHFFFVDSGNARVRRVDLTGDKHISVVAASVGWHRPTSCVATKDSLFVTDSGRHVVSKLDLASETEVIVAGAAGSPGCGGNKLRCPYDLVLREGAAGNVLFVTDPCCPDMFVRKVATTGTKTAPIAAFASGYEGTPEDRTVISVDEQGTGLWVAGIDDCGMEYIAFADGKRRPVDLVDQHGKGVDFECVIDVVAAQHKMYLLATNSGGETFLVPAETPKPNMLLTPESSESPAFLNFSNAFPHRLGSAWELQLYASNGSIVWRSIVDDGMSGPHGRGSVDLPFGLAPGKYHLTAASRRWPSVQSDPLQVTVKPASCLSISGLWGPSWEEVRLSDLINITQAGCSATAINAHHSWSPAFGTVRGSTLHMFGTVARIRGSNISWKNGISWSRPTKEMIQELMEEEEEEEGTDDEEGDEDREERENEESYQKGFTTSHLILAAVGGVVGVACIALLMIRCFLRVRHKGYGTMGGHIIYEPRGTAKEEVPREMAPIAENMDMADARSLETDVVMSGPTKLGV